MNLFKAVPLLRSPPFPGIAAKRAAISAPLAPQESERVSHERLVALAALLREARVGGAFWAPPLPPVEGRRAVVCPHGLAEAEAMLARCERGAAIVAILPDARWARRAARLPSMAGVTIVTGEVDPWSLLGPETSLIARPDDEWTLLAAIAGDDPAALPALERALIGAVAYRDCFTGARATPERAIAILAEWRRTIDANRGIAVASGMAWWKRRAIERFLWAGRALPMPFVDDARKAVTQAARAGGGVAVWPSRAPPGLGEKAAAADVPWIAVEDGFIRSIGLGSNLHPPLSIVVDASGIYYDPTRPSDLETILRTNAFPPALLERADRIARLIVDKGISKYARAAPPAAAPSAREDGRRVVLVAGQVEDDMSVRLGGGGVAGNLDLLRRARAAELDAYILFKPHPDVDAGHRQGRVPDAELLAFADEIVRDEAMSALLDRVDAVHVLTSLTGFEALLRGRAVTTHGHPFFAGWGLTHDLAGPVARRDRRLTLAQLVAATLILYPRYLDPVTGLPCPPETLLDRLAGGWRPKRSWLIAARRLQGRLAKVPIRPRRAAKPGPNI